MNTRFFTLFLLVQVLIVPLYAQTIPTDFDNLALWLDGSDGTTVWQDTAKVSQAVDGSNVALWEDKSGNNRNAIQASASSQPIFLTDQAKGKSALSFNGNNQFFGFDRINDIRTVFMVVKDEGSINNTPILGDSDVFHFHGGDNGKMFKTNNSNDRIDNGTITISGNVVSAADAERPQHYGIVVIQTTDSVQANQLTRDRAITNRTWKGKIVEVIIYTDSMDRSEVALISSYLSGKYSFSDGYVKSISNPVQQCFMAVDSVVATFANGGAFEISGFTVSYSVNGTVVDQMNFPQVLGLDEEFNYTFPVTYDFSTPGKYTIEVTISNVASDIVSSNNTISYTFTSKIGVFPFVEHFFEANHGWSTGGENSSWELGNPNNAIINGTPNSSRAWVTNLDGDYNSGENSYVLSPCVDLTQMTSPYLAMDILYALENDFDGAAVEYSLDNGASWVRLGAKTGQNATNWYNSDTVFALNFWSGNDNGWTGSTVTATGPDDWQIATFDLFSIMFETDVLFRVALASDFSSTDEGFAFTRVQLANSSELLDTFTVGVNDIKEADLVLTAYPNPFAQQLTIALEKPINGLIDINLTSLLGEQIYSAQVDGSVMVHSLHLPGIATGAYFLSIETTDNKWVSKLIRH